MAKSTKVPAKKSTSGAKAKPKASRAAKKSAPKKAASKATSAAQIYQHQVREIQAAKRASSPAPEGKPRFAIKNLRKVTAAADLAPHERAQVSTIAEDNGMGPLEKFLADEEVNLEIADVLDTATGKAAYQLYGWMYGCGNLFTAGTTDQVALACQHYFEAEEGDLRDVFRELGRAFQAADPPFEQSLEFPWK